ncbi:MAG: hypothetical protein HKN90_03775 [Flavobacteriaceae bacterium]|nr:hypothetical protein [Flavobacteriaceae bacterium]
MKIKNLLLFLVSITFVSCVFTEELYIKKDGSGSYAFKMDMSKMLVAMNDMGSENDSIKKEPEKIDSILYFKDILEDKKDSIAKLSKEEQEVLKSLEDLKIHLKMDEEKNQMNMDFLYEFNNVNELKNMNDRVQKAQAMSDKKQQKNNFQTNTDVEYEYRDDTFTRKVTLKKLSKEAQEEYENNMKQASSMFDETLYRIVYHFDDKIKSVSIEGATLSDDKKTLTIEMPMDTVMKNPFLLNFEVKLK